MEKSIEIYESLARPPKEALREIQAGKLKGKTNINPQWRYKAMTEKFGLVGIGWKYDVQRLWTEQGAGNEKLAFAQVAVYIKDDDKWSDPIVGIGGSRLVAIEKGAPVSNDEGYKMAVTDAFSTALKMLGVAADIYAEMWDGAKYKDEAPKENQLPPPVQAVKTAFNGQVQKGGPATAAEAEEIKTLLASTYNNGAPIFSKQEAVQYSQMRQNLTAAELIAQIKQDLQARIAGQQPAAEQQEIF